MMAWQTGKPRSELPLQCAGHRIGKCLMSGAELAPAILIENDFFLGGSHLPLAVSQLSIRLKG